MARVSGGKVPQDRVIDGVDQLDFFTGKQEKSNLDGFMVYVGNELFGVKWRNWKMMGPSTLMMERVRGSGSDTISPDSITSIMIQRRCTRWTKASSRTLLGALANVRDYNGALGIFNAKEPPIKSGTPDPYDPKSKREADWDALKKALENLGL